MRDYLQQLARDGELLEINRPVDPRHELAAVTLAAQRRGHQALRFNQVIGSALPVVTNLYTDRERFAALIGATRRSFCARWQPLAAALVDEQRPATAPLPRPAELVSGRLSDLPAIHYHERDAGAYLTAGIVLAKDPDSGVPNLSFHRALIVSDTELRLRIGERHDLDAACRKAAARGESLPAAILLGVSPALFMAACASIPRAASELALAARIIGAALPAYPAATVALEIPAATEIVIEGRIHPAERRPEGPFGEFLGYYVPAGLNPVFEISAVYWRPGAVFHSLLCGSDEDRVPLQMLTAAATYGYLAERLPGIVDVSCAPSLLNTTVAIDAQYAGHAREVMLATFDANEDYHKLVIVVDADDDPDDVTATLRALIARGRLDERTVVIRDRPGFYRDPQQDHVGRLGIDATRPFGRAAEFVKKTVPGAERIELDDYL